MNICKQILLMMAIFIAVSCKGPGKITENVVEKSSSVSTNEFENIEWQLVEAMGKPIAEYGEQMKKPIFTFDSKENRFHGNAGCNILNGSYKLREGGRVEFGTAMSTMMACPNMTLEGIVSEVLPTLDTYIVYNGSEMVLTKARMAPVLKFIKVKK
ncbi:MAG: META domain-containing protein [Chitinophagales bacterium]|nr:META domain-containing protein [Chitinophagales bacterium]